MKHKSMYISTPPRALTYQSPTHNRIQPLLHLRITHSTTMISQVEKTDLPLLRCIKKSCLNVYNFFRLDLLKVENLKHEASHIWLPIYSV